MCLLLKALSGLKQAPMAWYSCLDTFLQSHGLKRNATNHNWYFIIGHYTFFIVYIDDFLLIRDDEKWLEFLENVFIRMFEMFKFSFMNIYVELWFIHVVKGIFLFQHNYIVKIFGTIWNEQLWQISNSHGGRNSFHVWNGNNRGKSNSLWANGRKFHLSFTHT